MTKDVDSHNLPAFAKASSGVSRRRSLQALGAAGAAAFGIKAHAADTLKIASVNSLSGNLSKYGQEIQRGFDLAVELVNAKGGIPVGGTNYRIEPALYDDRSDGTTAARLAERAYLNDDSEMVVAGLTSGIARALIAVAQRLKRPMLAQFANLDSVLVVQKGDPYFFEPVTPFSQFYDQILKMLPTMGPPVPKRVVVVTRTDDMGAVFQRPELAKELAATGLELLSVELFPPGTQDFASIIDKVRKLAPQTLLLNCYTAELIPLLKEMDARNYFPPVLIVEAPSGLIEAVGNKIDGAIVPTAWDPSLTVTKDKYVGTSKDFAAAYKKKYGKDVPDFMAAMGANNVILFALVLEKLGKLKDPAGVLKGLKEFDGETFFAKIKFNDIGLNPSNTMYPAQFQAGDIKLVYPDNVRMAKVVYPNPNSVQSK
ncbi:ABC transporter substrate-binding protein [soil metagenome]